jgi:hypothetical protein
VDPKGAARLSSSLSLRAEGRRRTGEPTSCEIPSTPDPPERDADQPASLLLWARPALSCSPASDPPSRAPNARNAPQCPTPMLYLVIDPRSAAPACGAFVRASAFSRTTRLPRDKKSSFVLFVIWASIQLAGKHWHLKQLPIDRSVISARQPATVSPPARLQSYRTHALALQSPPFARIVLAPSLLLGAESKRFLRGSATMAQVCESGKGSFSTAC